jgi:hypothetical protein
MYPTSEAALNQWTLSLWTFLGELPSFRDQPIEARKDEWR